MKGDQIETDENKGQIVRIIFTPPNRIATIILFDGTRMKVDLNDYVWDEEKKVWKK